MHNSFNSEEYFPKIWKIISFGPLWLTIVARWSSRPTWEVYHYIEPKWSNTRLYPEYNTVRGNISLHNEELFHLDHCGPSRSHGR
jgi:hypothetical protein